MTSPWTSKASVACSIGGAGWSPASFCISGKTMSALARLYAPWTPTLQPRIRRELPARRAPVVVYSIQMTLSAPSIPWGNGHDRTRGWTLTGRLPSNCGSSVPERFSNQATALTISASLTVDGAFSSTGRTGVFSGLVPSAPARQARSSLMLEFLRATHHTVRRDEPFPRGRVCCGFDPVLNWSYR